MSCVFGHCTDTRSLFNSEFTSAENINGNVKLLLTPIGIKQGWATAVADPDGGEGVTARKNVILHSSLWKN